MMWNNKVLVHQMSREDIDIKRQEDGLVLSLQQISQKTAVKYVLDYSPDIRELRFFGKGQAEEKMLELASSLKCYGDLEFQVHDSVQE